MLILLLFMYIFQFKVFNSIDLVNSTILVSILLGIYFVINKKYRDIVISTFLNKKVILVFLFLLLVITYSLFISTAHLSYEYSIIKTLVNQFINIFIGIMLYSLYVKKNKSKDIMFHIIYIFIIQAIIQLISFISPQINEVLNMFRFENAILRGQIGYGNIRGLAISGSAFFGLSASYGLIFIYYFYNWKKLFINRPFMRYIYIVLLIFGGISAGRASLIGLIIGISLLLINSVVKTKFIVKFKFRILNVFLVMSLFVLVLIGFSSMKESDYLEKHIDYFKMYAFQFVYNYMNEGDFSTTSTDHLFEDMYFSVGPKTFLIGDGKYTNADGTYYMHTDAGYMRNILYFGIFGFLLLTVYQMCFFDWGNRKNLFINVIIVFYLLIMHIKGDIIGFLIMSQNILFIVYLYNLFHVDTSFIENGNKLINDKNKKKSVAVIR